MAEATVHRTAVEFSYFCAACKDGFRNSKRSFDTISSEDSEFTCLKCGKTFSSGFKTKKIHSRDALPYSCDDCGKKFRTSTLLQYHSYKHSLAWPLRCFICQKGFAADSQLKRHLVTETFDCSQCPKSFRANACPHWRPKFLLDKDEIKCKKCSRGSSATKYLTYTT
ncbi:hypothetical protein TNCT_4511 [Trichonephila clavata]|uniref:C2H2-type domain-containing protein n=1 Tax=Trichonephila clavata TaxID=2740835 RepID=A0A8X6HT13_TRICU|nr:hypothetical protein TNCT_4511 [Trichonephila clavata]